MLQLVLRSLGKNFKIKCLWQPKNNHTGEIFLSVKRKCKSNCNTEKTLSEKRLD